MGVILEHIFFPLALAIIAAAYAAVGQAGVTGYIAAMVLAGFPPNVIRSAALLRIAAATDRMRGRVAGLLGGRPDADQYKHLFEVRSAFLHGRTMTAISTKERVMARSLARRTVEALTLATRARPITSREDFLDDLLDKGAPLI